MQTRLPLIVALLFCSLFPGWVQAGPPASAADLRVRVDAALADASVRKYHGGVCIAEVATGNVLYASRADELFIPASNIKLLTTAAALDQLGPDFAFVTTFATRGGDLLVFASGDPGLGDERIAARNKRTIDAAFVAAAAALKQRGILRIHDVLVDDTVFDNENFHPNWSEAQRGRWYEAEVSGFNYNDNCVDIRLAPAEDGAASAVTLTPNTRYVTIARKRGSFMIGRQGVSNTINVVGNVTRPMAEPLSIPVTKPSGFAAQVLVETLAREGVAVAGKVQFQRLRRHDGSLPADVAVVSQNSQPLSELVWRSNTFSQNFVAESLFKSLGAYDGKSLNPSGQGSWASGRKAMAEFLSRRQLPAPRGLIIDDGSGLSKANQVSPELLAQLLVKMASHRASDVWFDSLAQGGEESGTLRKRFRDLNAGQMVLAKTGTVAGVSALSGYVRTPGKKEYAFSILFDRCVPANAKAAADKIVNAILELDPVATTTPATTGAR